MIKPAIKNETSRLRTVVLGLADDFGGTPSLHDVYDPKSKEHIMAGTYPDQKSISHEMHHLEEVFHKYDVELLRPDNIPGVNQIFARDIGFVIDNTFVEPNIIENRYNETFGIKTIIDQIPIENVVRVGPEVRIEGGDVKPWNDKIFVGYSEAEDFNKYIVSRTNKAGVKFLEDQFPNRKVHAFELNKSDDYAKDNALHLDCCFQPIGENQAILYKGGFKNQQDVDFLINYFGEENIIEINQEEMYFMYSNIFSISPEVIISCESFTRLNNELEARGFTVEKIKYIEIAKMEGLLRCSTMPIIRD
jgi:N-dimethylarginine dimethylaminohydrolase